MTKKLTILDRNQVSISELMDSLSLPNLDRLGKLDKIDASMVKGSLIPFDELSEYQDKNILECYEDSTGTNYKIVKVLRFIEDCDFPVLFSEECEAVHSRFSSHRVFVSDNPKHPNVISESISEFQSIGGREEPTWVFPYSFYTLRAS